MRLCVLCVLPFLRRCVRLPIGVVVLCCVSDSRVRHAGAKAGALRVNALQGARLLHARLCALVRTAVSAFFSSSVHCRVCYASIHFLPLHFMPLFMAAS